MTIRSSKRMGRGLLGLFGMILVGTLVSIIAVGQAPRGGAGAAGAQVGADDHQNMMDQLKITVESAANAAADARGAARDNVALRMKSRYGLSADVVLVEPGALPRSEGKAVRVRDLRKAAK